MKGESGFTGLVGLKFEGGGSQSESLKYLQLVAQVVSQATGDQQLAQIAQHLGKMGQPPQQGQQQPPQQPPPPQGM